MGGGTVFDVGVYVIQFSDDIIKQKPTSIQATGVLNSDGVDVGFTAKFEYPGGAVATVATSALEKFDNTAYIKGTKGRITVNIDEVSAIWMDSC